MHIHPDIFLFATLLVFILGAFARIIFLRARKKPISPRWPEAIKHIGQISLALGVLLQMIELSMALADTTSSLTTVDIAKGLRSTLFSTIHGLLVYIVAMVLFVILILTERKSE